MSNLKRGWMYERFGGRGGILSSFITGVNNFIQYACSQKNRMSGDKIKCPCKKCHNLKYMNVEMVKYHLFQYEFVENYFVWKYQGEEDVIDEMYYVNDLHGGTQPELGYDNLYQQMVLDVAGPNFYQDGYVSNLGKCPDTITKKLYGMKSHDCHVFMQRLLPIAFRELLPSNVWQALTELSLFFKDLTSTTLRVDDMERLEADIPQILSKIVGPVQYRWMYPFERYLGTLKRMIGNKASVEGSICEAYLMTESTLLFSHYFEPHVLTRNHNVDRNDDGGITEDLEGNLSIFTHPGRLWGETRKRNLSLDEIKAAQTYILLNCEEVEPFVR
ncbi:hypothetical protein MTR67_021733 [Solanum verrucosum]|uniref:Transposase-associated domain-containing protein n=1 Tax=Solanum verrucosum TaxID=315347 RepID=A0AAF0QS49_SOLVR|nr:hypothetical protein MTR67_021733 [Solanum verrucosum]